MSLRDKEMGKAENFPKRGKQPIGWRAFGTVEGAQSTRKDGRWFGRTKRKWEGETIASLTQG